MDKPCFLPSYFYLSKKIKEEFSIIKPLYISILFLFLAEVTIHAQNDSLPYFFKKHDVEKELYFLTNIVKIDLYSSIEGNVSISWEHHFSGRFTVEAGLGTLLPYNFKLISFGINKNFSPDNLGYSFFLAPKIYGRGFFHDLYTELLYNYKRYETLAISEYGLNWGYAWKFSDKLLLDLSAGITSLKQKSDNNGPLLYDNNTGVNIPISIKIGYIIN